jgi:hypothetical protein
MELALCRVAGFRWAEKALHHLPLVVTTASEANRRFVYRAGRLATSSQKTHCDGFLYSSGQPVEDDHRLCEGFDNGAKSRVGA